MTTPLPSCRHSSVLISIKTAVIECWPDVDVRAAIRAIKTGEISFGYSSHRSLDALQDTTLYDGMAWKVERRHGKRILKLVVLNDNDGSASRSVQSTQLWVQWKGDSRIVPSLPRFVAMHKPVGIITTLCERSSSTLVSTERGSSDEMDDAPATPSPPTVYDLLRQSVPHALHLRAIGRLDKNTEGLLLFTTRGGWIRSLSSPVRHVPKRYRCTLAHAATCADLDMWTSGTLQFRDRKGPLGLATARPALAATMVEAVPRRDTGSTSCPESSLTAQSCPVLNGTVVDVTIVEGRYRQVRRCWEALGNKVVRLQRLSLGPLELDTECTATEATSGSLSLNYRLVIPLGECRELSWHQVVALLPWVTDQAD